MTLDYKKIGAYISLKRKQLGMTQSELSERLHVTPQSVSNWERGETLPDLSLFPDLALLLNTSADELLGGGSCEWIYKKRITVERMSQAIDCIASLRLLLGEDHFMYRTMIDALDQKMNSSIEQAFINHRYKDAYLCEAIIEGVKNGGYVDLDDIKRNISSEKPRTAAIQLLTQLGNK